MDNENKEIINQAEESTIFTSPQEDTKVKKPRKKLGPVAIILILVLLLLILGGGIWALMYFGGNNATTSSTIEITTIQIIQNNTIDIEKINIENKSGKLEFYASKVSTEAGDMDSFLLTGYDPSLIADSYLTSIADKAAKLEALREMSGNGDYGFSSPNAIVKITGRNSLKDYSFTIGNQAPDNSGYYLMLDNSDKIYLIPSSVAELFLSKPEDLTNNSLIMPPNKDTVSGEYLVDNQLAYVDKIVISGANYENKITIVHTDNELAAYQITTPITRYAKLDAVNGYTELITSGITAQGCYKLLPTNADYEKYGITKPDALVEISYDKTKIKVTAKRQSDGNFAVVINDKKAIYKVSSSALNMLTYDLEDLLNDFVFLQELGEFSSVSFNDGTNNYKFDIKHDKDNNTTTETLNGQKIDDDLFRAYFDYYLYLKPEYSKSYQKGKTEFTATFNFADSSKSKLVVEFAKQNDRQYVVTINGRDQGVISYTYFENVKKYVNNVINKQGIPSPY